MTIEKKPRKVVTLRNIIWRGKSSNLWSDLKVIFPKSIFSISDYWNRLFPGKIKEIQNFHLTTQNFEENYLKWPHNKGKGGKPYTSTWSSVSTREIKWWFSRSVYVDSYNYFRKNRHLLLREAILLALQMNFTLPFGSWKKKFQEKRLRPTYLFLSALIHSIICWGSSPSVRVNHLEIRISRNLSKPTYRLINFDIRTCRSFGNLELHSNK